MITNDRYCFSKIETHEPDPAFIDLPKESALSFGYTEVLKSQLKFLAFKLADIALRCFPIGIDHTFNQLSKYHETRYLTRLYTLQALRENVVNFALNGSKLCVESEEDLHVRYGDDLKHMYNQISEIAPHVKEKLRPLKRGGMCFGSALDFIANIFQENKKSQDLFKTIKKVSDLYKNGTTLRAEMLQILHCARDTTFTHMISEPYINLASHYENAAKLLLQSREDRTTQFLQEQESPQSIQSYTEFLQQYDRQFGEIKEKINTIQDFFNLKMNELSIKNFLSPVSLIGIRASIEFQINYDKNSTTSTEAFVSCLHSLENGSYFIKLSTPESSSAHALAYIKESNIRSFLFEPNYATLVFNGEEDLKQKALKIINLTIKASAIIECYRCEDAHISISQGIYDNKLI